MSTVLTSGQAQQRWLSEQSPLPFDTWALSKGIVVVPEAPGAPPAPPGLQRMPTRLNELEGQNAPLVAPPAPMPMTRQQVFPDPTQHEQSQFIVPPSITGGDMYPSPQDEAATAVRDAVGGTAIQSLLSKLQGAPTPEQDTAADRMDDPAYTEAILKGLRGDDPGGDFFLTADGQVITAQQAMELGLDGSYVPSLGGTTSTGRATTASGSPAWAPPEMPLPVRPDYSKLDAEFAKLSPKEPDAGEQDEVRQDSMLMGLARGLLSPANDIGDVILNMAGGALGGWAEGRSQNRQAKQLYEERLADYQFKKLGLLETRANQDAEFANKVLEVEYTNKLNFWKANWDRVNRAGAGAPKSDIFYIEQDGKKVPYIRTQGQNGTSFKPFNSISGVKQSLSVLNGLGSSDDVGMALETYGFTAGSPEELAVVSLSAVPPTALQTQIMTPDEYANFQAGVNNDYQTLYGEVADGFGGVPGSTDTKRADYESVFDRNLIQMFTQSDAFRGQVFDYLARQGGYVFQ